MKKRSRGKSQKSVEVSMWERVRTAARSAPCSLHLRVGWWTLCVSLSLGIGLECLHAFKLNLYMDVSNEYRRLLWTLAHAHGTLLALVHIGFALTVSLSNGLGARISAIASRSLIAAGIMVPLGFLLGGAFLYNGEPGLGLMLVPAGGLLLVLAVSLIAYGVLVYPCWTS